MDTRTLAITILANLALVMTAKLIDEFIYPLPSVRGAIRWWLWLSVALLLGAADH